MARAASAGISLDDADAAIAKGMLNRGDRQHDIAAWFGVNGGRIAEVSTGKTFSHVAAATTGLPRSGPYLSGRGSAKAKRKLEDIKVRLETLLDEVETTISNM